MSLKYLEMHQIDFEFNSSLVVVTNEFRLEIGIKLLIWEG